uniref:Immunoglobulin V-set domain-containing protein n=1 Tax=Dicentrarchus labrax TaxID=13489 RepID=A0A8P4GLS9_DICLA
MLPVRVSQSFNLQSGAFTVLVFHTVVFLSLIHSCRGQHKVVCLTETIVAMVDEDVIFPCHLDPVMDAFGLTLEWGRPDLNPRFVLVRRDGKEIESMKHPSYEGRTSLFTDQLKQGNISLKLSKVKLSDEGRYRFFSPQLGETAVQLVVGKWEHFVLKVIYI